jgi:hypothetical protein
VKYKVSLLPEKNRKRLNSKKKAEKVKIISLIALCMVLVLLLVTVALKFYADSVLAEEREKNVEYDQMIQELAEYRSVNQTLQQKVSLIQSIQVEEPALYNFVAAVSNINHPDVSIEALDCVDWKSARICTITGTVHSPEAFDLYLSDLRSIEGVSATPVQFNAGLFDGVTTYQFVITVSCSGGKTPSAATVTEAQ